MTYVIEAKTYVACSYVVPRNVDYIASPRAGDDGTIDFLYVNSNMKPDIEMGCVSRLLQKLPSI